MNVYWGGSEFVNNVIADAEQKAKETLRLTLKISNLSSLARKVCIHCFSDFVQ